MGITGVSIAEKKKNTQTLYLESFTFFFWAMIITKIYHPYESTRKLSNCLYSLLSLIHSQVEVVNKSA